MELIFGFDTSLKLLHNLYHCMEWTNFIESIDCYINIPYCYNSLNILSRSMHVKRAYNQAHHRLYNQELNLSF